MHIAFKFLRERSSKKSDQPFRELRQLVPLHRAFAFLTAQMRLSQ